MGEMTAEVASQLPRVANAAPILEVSGIRREFGGVTAVDGASFSVARGTITGLIGPNGAGKSTMVAIIGGAIAPTAGTITLEGTEVTSCPAYKRARHGMVRTFQLSSEFGQLTVMENLIVAAPGQRGEGFLGSLLGRRYWMSQEREIVARAKELLERFNMTHQQDEYAANLSGGQKRLLEVMRGLMAEPKLLLLDEPMAGVNPTLALEIEGYLQELRDGGLTMLMVEHEMEVIERLCDPVVVMAQGRVIAEGPFTDVSGREEVLDAYLVG